MKKLFVSVLAIAGLVACNNEETIAIQGNTPMEFGGSFVENATRAAVDPSTTTNTLDAFDVWAFMDQPNGTVFEGEDVAKSGSKWAYTNVQYWLPEHTYYFGALAPMNSANWSLNTTNANTYGVGVVSFTNVDGSEDLLYAATSVSTAGMQVGAAMDPVKFQFNHMLSKVKFTFKNGYTTDNVSFVVSDVKMTAPAAGTIDLAVENWWDNDDWAVEGTNTLEFGNVEQLWMGQAAEATQERLTIPAGNTQEYKVTFTVDLYMGEVLAGTFNKESTITGTALEMGKAYNFVAEITPENTSDEFALVPIEFEVIEVKDWVTAATPDAQVAEAELKAAAQLGGVVTLTEDVVLTSPLVVKSAFVLNLNGKTLTNAVENTATDVIIVEEGATLTINGDGNITAVSGNDGYAVISEGTVIINGGTITSGVDANGEPNAVVYVRGNGEVYVNGGNFPNANASKYVLNKKDSDRATTVIEVKGGTFGAFNPANNAAENPGTNFCAEGYGVAVDGDVYTVMKTTVTTVDEFVAALGVAEEVKLAGDIDLSDVAWTPVGTATEMFSGVLDGQGNSIIGLNVTGDYAAFVAYAAENATIKNVNFEDVNIESTKYGAAVVCVAEGNVTLENVTVSGSVTATSYAAGLVLMNNDDDDAVIIKNCENNATVTSNRAGGVAAWVTGGSVIEGCVNNGDITGAISACGITNRIAGTIKNCVNNGTIVGNGTEPSAGIAGTQTAASTFEYCKNYGNVTTTKDNANASAAGILGQTPSKAATINYCANYGDITAEQSYAAGIAYSLYGNINASYCYNEGAVSGADAAGAIAPKAQYGANDKANYCLNAGVITSSNGKVYQGSNKNTSSYYYSNGALLNVANNAAVAEADALAVLNGGADADFFSTENGKIVVK